MNSSESSVLAIKFSEYKTNSINLSEYLFTCHGDCYDTYISVVIQSLFSLG